MIVLDWYCTLTYTKCFSSFLCSEIHGIFQNVNGDLMFVFSIMLLSCTVISLYCSVLSFDFAFSFASFFMYKGPISVLKKGIFLGKRAWPENFSGGFASRPPFVSSHPGAMPPQEFFS